MALFAVDGLSGSSMEGMVKTWARYSLASWARYSLPSSEPELDRLVRLARPSVAVAKDSTVEVEPPLPLLILFDIEPLSLITSPVSFDSTIGPRVVSTEPSELKLP